ncbi:MAG: aminodeoxychorismate synthase component I [Spirochaetes bacterium]|nr:MAG: aminodeoxychorismate synthase component I [Spirochaetota bacterium]
MNRLGASRIPFLFIIDYEMRHPTVLPLPAVDPRRILYAAGGISNCGETDARGGRPVALASSPVAYDLYMESFNRLQRHLRDGDSYLANLTFRTPVVPGAGLREIFFLSRARYRLWWADRFVVFSPECFIRIEAGKIAAFPMKGTIDASIPGARETLLADEKELAEHLTIVDLLRNDLSIVARNVRVERFRYAEPILAGRSAIIQTSSEVCGELPGDYHARIGDIVASLLPAGSVTGAPKKKTVEIISEVEDYSRGYYTGVFGIFDGNALDSAVMIRFIGQEGNEFYYKSGGGITVYSDPRAEYEEMVRKIYVPVA